MQCMLEVGKSYITAEYDHVDPADDAVVKLVGLVDPDTCEYKRGYRFFSESGNLYLPNGDVQSHTLDLTGPDIIINEGDPSDSRNIVGYAFTHHLKQCHEEFARISLEECEKSDKFVSYEDPGFHMALGQVYVNRMGMLRLIDKIDHFNDEALWGPGGGKRFRSGREGYWSNGKERDDTKTTMVDIVYQRIS